MGFAREAMIATQLLAASVLVAFALPASLAAAPPASKPAASPVPAAAQPAPTRRTPFTHFGTDAAIELRGDGAAAAVDFGNRADELVTRATLHLRYMYSVELAPGASHIKVVLNDELVGTLPVTAADAGSTVTRAIEVDPRLVVGSNKLSFVLAAAQGEVGADGARPGMWAEVSGASELEVAVQPLAVADDLAILPEPFFDRRDQRRVTIPFAFNAHPSTATLAAAAVVASRFGQLAQWRGARFPASLELAPPGHAIAFAANNERPAFLASLPPATGPALRVMTNPHDGRSKLLVLLGRDGAELKAAAEALAAGTPMMGAAMQVQAPPPRPARAAYDAPALVTLERPVRLAELLEWPQQLQTAGRAPELPPVKVDLRVPPDLATWRGPGVPLDLQFSYGPTPCISDGQLEVAVNEEPLRVVGLRAANEAVVERQRIHLPPYRMVPRMRVQFAFRFTPSTEPTCRGSQAAIKASVSPESTIDFSGFPHYARMPNLAHFAAVGYPFTRFADLSQTVVVLPERPVAADIETMLGLMGRMGEATGLPVTGVRIATPADEAALADADLLVIGSTPQQSLLSKWAGALPVAVTGYGRRGSAPEDRPPSPFTRVSEWLGIAAPADTSVATQVSFEGGGPIAAFFGFESPVTPGRSVVAVTAVSPHQLERALDALDDAEQRKGVRGNAAFVLPGKVESVLVGRGYTVGFMPPWTGAGYWLLDHPTVLVAVVVAVLLILAGLCWFAARRVGMWRAQRAA